MNIPNNIFHCKEFDVRQDKSLMKVNTDAVLLGAWADVDEKMNILDIGTGTGIIALMMAQRTSGKSQIVGVEIDESSANEAKLNFQQSTWRNNLECFHISIQEYVLQEERKFDLILSNPPFFSGGTLSINENKTNVKHTVKLSHADLLRSINILLGKEGKVSMILPYLEGERFLEIAERAGLFPLKITEVKSKDKLPVERLLFTLVKRKRTDIKRDGLIMLEEAEGRVYTESYKILTKDYYTIF